MSGKGLATYGTVNALRLPGGDTLDMEEVLTGSDITLPERHILLQTNGTRHPCSLSLSPFPITYMEWL